jgi:hypothetical protein
MTILSGVSAFAAVPRGFGCSRLCVTKMRPPRCSTVQQSIGLSAGARAASPVRRSKQAGHEAFGKRAMVMAAMGADGEYFAAAAHQQNFLVADMAQKLVVLDIAEADALGQIRAARRRLLLGHGRVPPLAPSASIRRRIKNRWIAAEKVPPLRGNYQFGERGGQSHFTAPRYPFNCAVSNSTIAVVMCPDGSQGRAVQDPERVQSARRIAMTRHHSVRTLHIRDNAVSGPGAAERHSCHPCHLYRPVQSVQQDQLGRPDHEVECCIGRRLF